MDDGFGDEQDFFPSPTFFERMDKMVEAASKTAPAQRPSSSQGPPQLSPEMPLQQHQPAPQVHRLYGALNSAAGSIPQARPAYGQRNGRLAISNANSAPFQQNPPAPPRPYLSPGVFGNLTPSPARPHGQALYPWENAAAAAAEPPLQPRNGVVPFQTLPPLTRPHSQPGSFSQKPFSLRARFGKPRTDPPTGSAPEPMRQLPAAQPVTETNSLLQAQINGIQGPAPNPSAPANPQPPANGQPAQHMQMQPRRVPPEAATSPMLSHPENRAGHAALQSAINSQSDLQRRLDAVMQQMAFQSQELLEEKRRNSEFSERIRGAESLLQQVQGEKRKLEAVKAQLEQEVEEGNRKRRARIEAADQTISTPAAAGGAALGLHRVSKGSSPARSSRKAPPQKGKEKSLLAQSTPSESEEKAVAEVVPPGDPPPQVIPAWERLRMTPSQNSLAGLDLWSRGSMAAALPALMQSSSASSVRAAPGFEATSGSLSTAENPDLVTLSEQVKLLARSEDDVGDVLVCLAKVLAAGRKAVRRHAEQSESPRRDDLPSASLAQLSAGLRVLAALLRTSRPARRFVAASCAAPSSAAEHASPQLSRNAPPGDAARRVTVGSKGSILRAADRQKDRPPDPRALGKFTFIATGKSDGASHGLAAMLLGIQSEIARLPIDQALAVLQKDLLEAMLALTGAGGSEFNKAVLATSGLASFAAHKELPELHGPLLSLLSHLAEDEGICAALTARCRANGGQDSPTREFENGLGLLQAPLLALSIGGGEIPPDTLRFVRKAIGVCAKMVEIQHLGLLQRLLTDRTGGEPALAARLVSVVTALLEALSGTSLFPKRIEEGQLRCREFQTRIQAMHEAMLLLRCLVGERATAAPAIEDLISNLSSQSSSLCLASRLMEWQLPPDPSSGTPISSAAWVLALGLQYTCRPFYAQPHKTSCAAVAHELAYLGRSLRRHLLHRAQHTLQG